VVRKGGALGYRIRGTLEKLLNEGFFISEGGESKDSNLNGREKTKSRILGLPDSENRFR
jgi:hypothetical protein